MNEAQQVTSAISAVLKILLNGRFSSKITILGSDNIAKAVWPNSETHVTPLA
jgi:hypothetical protein